MTFLKLFELPQEWGIIYLPITYQTLLTKMLDQFARCCSGSAQS